MNDYINYIDFNAIKLGDLANEIGDYKCAVENYSKALTRLRNYQGDRMQPIMMASGLVEKINEISNKIEKGISVLRFDYWKLTKSSYVKGNQCLKYLYLDKHKKHERIPPSKETQELFDKGHSFEQTVREIEFPNGINVKDKVGNFAYFNSYTEYLLKLKGQQVLYEATLISDEVLIMCDVLIKHENGLIDVYEIKLNTDLNAVIKSDLSIQYLILKKRFQNTLNSINVVLRSENNDSKWSIFNLTKDLEETIGITETKIIDFKKVLINNEPLISMGDQCEKPCKCEFIEYCKNKC